MRTCFVHVPIPLRKVENRQRYWENFDRRYKSVHPVMKPMRKALFELPHWVPWLAGVVRAAGFDDLDAVELYTDCTLLNGMDEHRVVSTMRAHEADVYLFSPMTINLPQALRIAELVKELYPAAKTVFGGIVATPLHREVAAHPCVDYVVRDRGEYALPDLLRRLRGDDVAEPPRNLTYTDDDGTVVTTPGLHPYPAVADIPFPVVDIFPAETGQDLRYIRQNYALGCPFTCDFCTIQTIGRKPSYFSISRVLAEIDAYREHYGHHHHVYFGDETFTLHADHTLELCSALADRGDIYYDCQTRLNCFRDARLPDAMFESGCRWVELGLESANQDTQDDYKQHTSLSQVETTLARLADAGLPTCTFLIVGLPNETLDNMRRSVDYVTWLLERGLLTASYISVFVPYPGTPMFNDPERHGMRLHHHAYDLYNEELPPVFDSPYATAAQIYRIFEESVGQLADAMAGPPTLATAGVSTQPVFGEFYRGG